MENDIIDYKIESKKIGEFRKSLNLPYLILPTYSSSVHKRIYGDNFFELLKFQYNKIMFKISKNKKYFCKMWDFE